MKRLMIGLAMAVLPLMATTASAQLLMKKYYDGRQDATYYLAGAVPEREGKIVFTKEIEAQGKSARDLFYKLGQWADLRYTPNTTRGEWTEASFFHNYEYAGVTLADVDEGTLVCQGDEELVFTNKVLNRDATRTNYILRLSVRDGHVTAEISQIYFTYVFVEEPERMAAEEWISDREAFDKKGRLLKSVARFRVKTVDLKDELFKEIEEAVR